MAGGFNTGLSVADAQDVGSVFSGGSGWTGLTTGGSTYTKGAWTQLIAATTADIAWVMVQMTGYFSGGFWLAYDIGIGASGSEVAIVSNLVSATYGPDNTTYMFPLCIKAGTRIAARASSNNASDGANIKMTCFDDTALSAGFGSGVDTYGFSSGSNQGVLIDPGGTANTKGSYSQITSSLTNDIAGFFLGIDDQSNTGGGSSAGNGTLFDIAIGASGSEKIIVPNLCLLRILGGTTIHIPDGFPYIPMPIKAGTRVAARAQCATTISPDRQFGITLYGVRQ